MLEQQSQHRQGVEMVFVGWRIILNAVWDALVIGLPSLHCRQKEMWNNQIRSSACNRTQKSCNRIARKPTKINKHNLRIESVQLHDNRHFQLHLLVWVGHLIRLVKSLLLHHLYKELNNEGFQNWVKNQLIVLERNDMTACLLTCVHRDTCNSNVEKILNKGWKWNVLKWRCKYVKIHKLNLESKPVEAEQSITISPGEVVASINIWSNKASFFLQPR